MTRKTRIDENGFTVHEGHTESLDLSFLDMGGKIDNTFADAAYGLSHELFQRNTQRQIAEDFEGLVDASQG